MSCEGREITIPVSDASFGWGEALIAYLLILVASFLVTWIVTDRLRVSRTPYVGVLTLVSVGLLAGYLAWSGPPSPLLASNRAWGILAGVVAGLIVAPGLRRYPAREDAHGAPLAEQFPVGRRRVYGVAEAVLLATLPVLALWQAAAGSHRK